MAVDPSLDAFLVEAVHAARQEDADIVGFKLHEANRASSAQVVCLLLQLIERLLHIQYSGPLFLLQVLTGRQQGLSHEPIYLPASIREEHEHQKGNKEQVDPNDDDQIILANIIERQVILGRMELLKQLAQHKHHPKCYGKLIVERLLIVHEPSVEDYDVIQADAVGRHRAEVYYVLA